MPDCDDMTPSERLVVLAWRLSAGDRYTTIQAAQMLGVPRCDAWRKLMQLCRVVPIFYDDPDDPDGPRWQRLR